MKKAMVILVSVLVLMAPKLSFAVNVVTDVMEITSVQSLNNGGFALYLASEVNTACTKFGSNAVWFQPGVNAVTADGVDSSLAVALTAFTTGKNVKVMYDPATANCYGKELTILK